QNELPSHSFAVALTHPFLPNRATVSLLRVLRWLIRPSEPSCLPHSFAVALTHPSFQTALPFSLLRGSGRSSVLLSRSRTWRSFEKLPVVFAGWKGATPANCASGTVHPPGPMYHRRPRICAAQIRQLDPEDPDRPDAPATPEDLGQSDAPAALENPDRPNAP